MSLIQYNENIYANAYKATVMCGSGGDSRWISILDDDEEVTIFLSKEQVQTLLEQLPSILTPSRSVAGPADTTREE